MEKTVKANLAGKTQKREPLDAIPDVARVKKKAPKKKKKRIPTRAEAIAALEQKFVDARAAAAAMEARKQEEAQEILKRREAKAAARREEVLAKHNERVDMSRRRLAERQAEKQRALTELLEERAHESEVARAEAIEKLSKWTPDGSTEIYTALSCAYADSKVRHVHLLSDGDARDHDKLLRKTREWSQGGLIPCNTVSIFAHGRCRELMQEIAEESQGTTTCYTAEPNFFVGQHA